MDRSRRVPITDYMRTNWCTIYYAPSLVAILLYSQIERTRPRNTFSNIFAQSFYFVRPRRVADLQQILLPLSSEITANTLTRYEFIEHKYYFSIRNGVSIYQF